MFRALVEAVQTEPSRPALPTGPWHLVLHPAGLPGWQNMAIDHGLLDLAERNGVGFLRLYRWEPACLSFGRNEPALLRYDRALIERRKLDVVRRPTGGRAVWHGPELTYAAAAPIRWFGTPSRAFLEIHRMLAAALTRLGLTITLAPARRAASLASGPCFSRAVGGELLAGGRKILGSAQLCQGAAFLQHGSLQLTDSQDRIREVTREPAGWPPPPHSASGCPVDFAAAAAAVTAAAAEVWPGDWKPFDPAGDPAPRHHAARYRSLEWSWQR
jgi:lipoate-protein ligase A